MSGGSLREPRVIANDLAIAAKNAAAKLRLGSPKAAGRMGRARLDARRRRRCSHPRPKGAKKNRYTKNAKDTKDAKTFVSLAFLGVLGVIVFLFAPFAPFGRGMFPFPG